VTSSDPASGGGNHFDSAGGHQASGRAGRRVQLVLGSDYPFPWQSQPVDHIFACTSLSDEEKAGILGLTAAKLINVQA
jgi:hypothetical protein